MATIKIKHLFQKGGMLYYSRRIPGDLKAHYSKSIIRTNLKTSDIGKAARLVAQYAAKDDVLWRMLRSPEGREMTTPESRAAAEALLQSWGGSRGLRPRWYADDHPHEVAVIDNIEDYMMRKYGKDYAVTCDSIDFDERLTHPRLDDFYSPIEREAIRLLNESPETRRYCLSDALERYLAEHKRGQDIRFSRDTRRAIGIVTEITGDLPLGDYTRDHARAVRDALIPNHVTGTVRRRLSSINAVFNLGRREFDIQCQNPFEKLAIAQEGLDATKRLPFTQDELQRISTACHEADDDIRWIVAIQLATGARLAEIVGLRREDAFLDHEVPHIWIRPHKTLGRTLKTPGSERLVPLFGIGLWGARRAVAAGGSDWLFPRYASDNDIRATHASNTVNKWIRGTLGITKTTHSARHSMKDLLRNSGCSEEIAKALLGHGSRSVADSYGAGFSLPRLKEALEKAIR
jgi:integrase